MFARTNVPTDSIRLSDPAILADSASHTYYMIGTGGLMWRSSDLKLWDGPFRVTEFDSDSWMGAHPMIWAAELHRIPHFFEVDLSGDKLKVKIEN